MIANYNMEFPNTCSDFMIDVGKGLSQKNKQLSSKYFYDRRGSFLFNQITRHPDYYLTNCELDILTQYKDVIAALFTNQEFNLIELGPGEGLKTNILLEEFLQQTLQFTYYPIDISKSYLLELEKKILQQWPELRITGIQADYFAGIKSLAHHNKCINLVLFLGSSIGNFDFAEANQFLHNLWQSLNNGDYLLIGFDLRKDIKVLLRAYNDSDGLTYQFDMNILKRINAELGGNFDISLFDNYNIYNVYTGAIESYLISRCEQEVYIKKLHQTFHFEQLEPIHIETSFKFSLPQIRQLAYDNNFEIIHNFTDQKNYFLNSLWQVKK